MKKVLLTALIFLICLPALAQDYTVERIVDGNTLKLTNGKIIKLIGVDLTVRHEMESKAKKFVESMELEGHEVRVEFDVQKKDRDGKLLAYVFLDYQPYVEFEQIEGWYYGQRGVSMYVFVNASVIKSGYAQPARILPNVKYDDLFQGLYQEAKENNRGLQARQETSKKKSFFKNFINGSSSKPEEPKGLLKYIDENGVKLDTSF